MAKLKSLSPCVLLWLPLLLCLWSLAGCVSDPGDPRYLLYSVNPGEGFNLRRDVHMRAATLLKELQGSGIDWVLVLPPWPHLLHWRSKAGQSGVKWDKFFDVSSLSEYVPSIEYEEYLQREGHSINKVIHLQGFAEGWGEGGFREMSEERPCIDTPHYRQTTKGDWRGNVFGTQVTMTTFSCVSVLGFTRTLLPLLQHQVATVRSVMLERMETVMHSEFGGSEYWAARSSMVYAQRLREKGNQFMRTQLNYDPGLGNGRVSPKDGGGGYLSVHLRRGDYIYARPDKVPSLEDAARQINKLKNEQNLERVFLSSDATPEEKELLGGLVRDLVWYQPSHSELRKFGDGGVAIIDQWIAAHATYFVGTSESTFSFRIREDRQLMGFSTESTFNQLCGRHDPHCDRPTVWAIHPSVLSHGTLTHRDDEL